MIKLKKIKRTQKMFISLYM